MRSRRFKHRQRPEPPRLFNTWMTLGFLALMLIMLLMMRSQVADSAAGCFTNMTAPADQSLNLDTATDEESSNVRVIPPPPKQEP
jgi:hypothetical protein